jgi:hypothetical protein
MALRLAVIPLAALAFACLAPFEDYVLIAKVTIPTLAHDLVIGCDADGRYTAIAIVIGCGRAPVVARALFLWTPHVCAALLLAALVLRKATLVHDTPGGADDGRARRPMTSIVCASALGPLGLAWLLLGAEPRYRLLEPFAWAAVLAALLAQALLLIRARRETGVRHLTFVIAAFGVTTTPHVLLATVLDQGGYLGTGGSIATLASCTLGVLCAVAL